MVLLGVRAGKFDTHPAALREHTSLTARAVVLVALVGVPLAVLAYWVPALAGPILSFTGVLYTIPSLALFALSGPLLGVGAVHRADRVVLYALLAIVRNALAGLRQVPADVREAAEAMGYGRYGLLLRVEMPLALPSILTGLRWRPCPRWRWSRCAWWWARAVSAG